MTRGEIVNHVFGPFAVSATPHLVEGPNIVVATVDGDPIGILEWAKSQGQWVRSIPPAFEAMQYPFFPDARGGLLHFGSYAAARGTVCSGASIQRGGKNVPCGVNNGLCIRKASIGGPTT